MRLWRRFVTVYAGAVGALAWLGAALSDTYVEDPGHDQGRSILWLATILMFPAGLLINVWIVPVVIAANVSQEIFGSWAAAMTLGLGFGVVAAVNAVLLGLPVELFRRAWRTVRRGRQ
ncbi:hypothetical protein ACFO1B_02535 [Dactylosporangium siamense]|uniref:Uncharacterized protein n=1 Tax=Dactylosporangium siamense TaxID=685454 RepID=A0A919PR29_9ACTN|nr:hypothetical protein [Dactylosporangium siamense]GIG48544.1 hypothetical protein Dsi01nite_065850 [Dactylosporangium siamense]